MYQQSDKLANETPANGDELSVRERLLNAAEQVVARDGVRTLTLDAVAKEAGVSKGGLLYHFPSKSELITAIVEKLACRCEADQTAALAQDDNTVGAFTRAYLTTRIAKPMPQERPVHSALLAAAATDPDYLAPFRKRCQEWQARLNQDGIDPSIASIVRLAIDGLCLCRLLGIQVPEGEAEQRVIEKLMTMTRSDTNNARSDEGII